MCIKSLREEGFEVTGFWCNPSIHPFAEWLLRKDSVEILSKEIDMPVIYDENYPLLENLQVLLSQPNDRCSLCYRTRLEKTAQIANERGFEAFSTSLLYSKYQNHEAIIREAREVSKFAGVDFLYRDFRPLWGRGISASKKLGLYRQRWCGCVFSEFEAESARQSHQASEMTKAENAPSRP